MYGQPRFLSDSSSEDSQSPEAKAESKLIREGMVKLFESDVGKDFEIVVKDSRIKVHKSILMSEDFYFLLTQSIQPEQIKPIYLFISTTVKSPVFRTMFISGLEESSSNELTIEDFSFEVVEQMIEALYKGKPSKLNSMAKQLLEISNKVSFCSQWFSGEFCVVILLLSSSMN